MALVNVCDGIGLDINETECLNTDDNVVELLKHGRPLSSSADAQLFFNIKLNVDSRIQCLKIEGPPDGTAPCKLRLYANRKALAFDDVDAVEEDQVLTLSPDDVAKGTLQQLRMAKFGKVGTISILVETNQGNTDRTVITKLELLGQPQTILGTKVDRPSVVHSRIGDAAHPTGL